MPFAICRLPPGIEVPGWVKNSSFYSITKTEDELSVVCEQGLVPFGVKVESGWCLLKVEGTLDFSLTGILAGLTKPLAEAQISLFAISTFDTDYLLVKSESLEKAVNALTESGHSVLK